MRYATLCSGIGAPETAWTPLGWECVFHAEIEPFPSAVLKHHQPGVPNYGDMTKFKEWPNHADNPVDLICAGCPCQSFSVAGLRKGLDDPRGNLTLTYLAVLDKYRPRWMVYENVPGLLSDKTGAFGAFLGGLAELGYGFAYRILDAQFVRVESHPGAVPQRRRRLFVVGYLGDWRPAAAVLFEQESLSGHPAPRREAGKRVACGVDGGFAAGGGSTYSTPAIGEIKLDDCSSCISKNTGAGGETQNPAFVIQSIPSICGALSDGAHNGGGGMNGQDAYTGRIIPCV